jgi:polyisoprenoid-binding protein YceI
MTVQEWSLDSTHSSVGFWVRHLMVTKIRGTFNRWTGTIQIDERDPSLCRVDVRIEAASVDTNEPQRDGHLRSADFFEVDRYPHITFKSTSIERAAEGQYRLLGDLTIRGVTREVALEVEDCGRAKHPMTGDSRAGFSARTSIRRADFGLTWNALLETGGVAVSDKVEIDLEIQALRAA